MARDYMPAADAAFNLWLQEFTHTFGLVFEEIGFFDGDVEYLISLRDAWNEAYAAHAVAQTGAQGARLQKDAARAEAEALVRRYAAQVQANPGLTDAQRLALGLPIRSTERTPSRTPETAPELIADASQRGVVRLRFGESPSDGVRNKLAAGATAVILEFRPRRGAAWRWLACAAGTEFVHVVGGDSATELEYRARYAGRDGESGPSSAVVLAFAAPVAA